MNRGTVSELSVVVIARDEAAMLPGCLRRLTFADEVIVVIDDRTSDGSGEIAERAGATVIRHRFTGFADMKNAGLDRARGQWVLFVDADERVSRELASEIRGAIGQDHDDAFRVPIANFFYGRRMAFGGWQERPVRLVRSGRASFVGDIHEVIQLQGAGARIADLHHPLAHFSHRSVLDNLHKTAVFGDVQARELAASNAAPVTARRLFGTVLKELVHRLILRQGWRDGIPGVIEALYQPLSLFTVQARLWELQQDPSIEQRYRELEDETW